MSGKKITLQTCCFHHYKIKILKYTADTGLSNLRTGSTLKVTYKNLYFRCEFDSKKNQTVAFALSAKRSISQSS